MQIKSLLFTLLMAACACACREIGPDIDFLNDITLGDTTFVAEVPAAQMRHILLEDFTGVRCSNCPAAHEKIAQLKASFGEKIVPVSLHTGFYAVPYPNSKQDFKTSFAEGIEQLFGNSGYPNGLINRQLFAGETTEILPVNKWENNLSAQINTPAQANIILQKSYDAATRRLTINANIRLTQALPEAIALSAMVLESNLKDLQLKPTGIDTSYIHQHILRTMLTPYNGNKLNADTYPAGRTFVKNLQTTLPANYVPQNCLVVVFVHYIGTNKTVLQVAETQIL